MTMHARTPLAHHPSRGDRAAARPASRSAGISSRSGIDHVVFEKHRAGHAWRAERWDTFCLVTPNWQCQLPGFPYQRSPIRTASCCATRSSPTSTAFVASFDPPLREGVAVTSLRSNAQHGLHARDHRRHLHRRSGRDRGRRLPDADHSALRRAAAGGPRADPFLRISQSGRAARRRGAGRRQRPIRLPDRRRPASRRPQSASRGRRCAARARGAIAARTWSSGCT